MPFVKRADSRDTHHPTEARKLFIGRIEELHFFREHILTPEDPAYNIVSISGQGGVGKSTLLLRFIEDARATDFKDCCLSALVNERQAAPADIMEAFASQLHIEGDFEKALKHYKDTLRKLQSQREAAREALARQMTTDVAGSVVKDVPFVGGILKEGVEVATSYLFDELHYRQLLKDAERLENPLGDLTQAFIVELNRLADTQVTTSSTRVKRRRRILLFFDTFEQLATECAPWLLDYFLETEVSNNIIIVIAGRDPLERSTPSDPKRWLPYYDNNVIYSISLDSFSLEETRRYLAERGIIEEERIEAIWYLSHGLPLYLGFLTSNPHGQVDPTTNVVANFLRWIPEQEQVKRRLALDASLFSRPFNQDELRAFTYVSEQERPTLFQWLITQPFVQSNFQDGKHLYHELAQEMFNRHLYQLSPSQCQATREALVKYYQELLKNIEASQGKDGYGSPQWLELILALIYQLILQPDEASHLEAVGQVFKTADYVDHPGEIIKVLRKLSREDINKQVSSGAQQIIKHLLQILQVFETSSEEGISIKVPQLFEPVNYFIAKVTHVPSISPKTKADIYRFRGYAFFQLKQYEQAIADLTQAIDLYSRNAESYSERADIYRDLKQYEQAIADYARSIELEPGTAKYYSYRGDIYRDLKQYEQAIADYTRAIELDLSSTHFNRRGNTYRNLRQYEQAIADYTRAIELNPNVAVYYSNRGNIHSYLKQYEQAIADYTRAIELAPSAAVYYSDRGNSHNSLKRYEQAIADYTRAIELDPNVAVYYSNRGRSHRNLKQYERAIADYTRAIELVPGAAKYYFNRGLAYHYFKQYEQAIADYTNAIELDPTVVMYYPNRAYAYYAIKQYERAIADCSRVIELDPTDADSYYIRGKLCYECKQYEQAIADYTQAIKLSPEDGALYNSRGTVNRTLGQIEEALADYEQAIKLDPNNIDFSNNRDGLHMQIRNTKAGDQERG